jgi:tRNA/rRNA methyltransferase
MNLGQAVAVCLYELARNPGAARRTPAAPRPATSADLERLTDVMLEVLERSGYVNPVTAASTRLKTRRLIRRLALTERDAIVLTGMMRQILWKLTEGSSDVQDRNPSGTVAAAG